MSIENTKKEIQMKRIFVPDSAQKIINKLKENGYDAYIVGGCVRDALLGRAPYDYDITTSALPQTVKQIFPKTVDTGISHGTVTVISDAVPYEVTTFRVDGEYLDSRHPVSVSYTKRVEHDLARRDFTVNALCYNHDEGLVDVFGGVRDLEQRLIRAVGDPYLRFSEDALRVFRGIRFAATLGFEIEAETERAIFDCKDNLKNISVERIYVEWSKLLGGSCAYGIIKKYKDVIAVCIPELENMHIPERVKFEALSAEERQIALFASACDAKGLDSAMRRLRVDNKTREYGVSVLKNLTLSDGMSDTELKLYLLNISDECALSAARVAFALGMCDAGVEKRIEALLLADNPRRISQLAIGGREIMDEGFVGEQVGSVLGKLLRAAAAGEIENTKDALTDFVRRIKSAR